MKAFAEWIDEHILDHRFHWLCEWVTFTPEEWQMRRENKRNKRRK